MKFTINNRKFYIEFLADYPAELTIENGAFKAVKFGKYILYLEDNGEYKKLLASYTYEILYRTAYRVATHKSIRADQVPAFRIAA
jgi:hypothetical protein